MINLATLTQLDPDFLVLTHLLGSIHHPFLLPGLPLLQDRLLRPCNRITLFDRLQVVYVDAVSRLVDRLKIGSAVHRVIRLPAFQVRGGKFGDAGGEPVEGVGFEFFFKFQVVVRPPHLI